MPELPEVETVRNTLKELIIGCKIEDVELLYDRIIEDDNEVFKKAVINQTINDIDRYGKYLIFKLDNVAFISHLRMEGKYNYVSNQEPLGKHDHIIFKLDNGKELRYNDTRKFGRIKLMDIHDYLNQEPLKKLGYEPFNANLDVVYQKLHKTKHAIKDVLLDQTVLTGIGNIYANEICFQMHLDPFTPACNLSKKRVEELIQISSDILNKAIKEGGTTIHSFSANGIDGLFQVSLNVHMRKVCMVCGSEIKKEKLHGRGTYYCPKCQKRHR